jgi:hypothetical protein
MKGDRLRTSLMLSVLGLGLAAPAGAQPIGGGAGGGAQGPMQAMRYYVGTWNCAGGAAGQPSAVGTVAFTMDGTALRSSVGVAAQGKLSRAWLSVETKYDPAKQLYVDTAFDDGGWDVSYARPWTGQTEDWMDHSTANGKLGHIRFVRVDNSHYVETGYATMAATQPEFKITCTRK